MICNAIQSRHILHLVYDYGTRIVEPHAYGASKDGNDLLRAYQTGGASVSGERMGWKLFRMDEVSSLSDSGQTFAGQRSGYKRGDKAMETIYCQL